MTVSAEQIAVGGTAVALNTDVGTVGGTQLVINNTGAGAADLGPSTVTTGTGFELAAGATVTVDLGLGDQLFAIESVAATGTTLAVLRIG